MGKQFIVFKKTLPLAHCVVEYWFPLGKQANRERSSTFTDKWCKPFSDSTTSTNNSSAIRFYFILFYFGKYVHTFRELKSYDVCTSYTDHLRPVVFLRLKLTIHRKKYVELYLMFQHSKVAVATTMVPLPSDGSNLIGDQQHFTFLSFILERQMWGDNGECFIIYCNGITQNYITKC